MTAAPRAESVSGRAEDSWVVIIIRSVTPVEDFLLCR